MNGAENPKSNQQGQKNPKANQQWQKIPNQINRGRKIKKINIQGQRAQTKSTEFQIKASFSIGFYKPVFLMERDKFLTKTTGSEVSQIITGLWLTDFP